MAYENRPIEDEPFGYLMEGEAGPLIQQVRQGRAAREAMRPGRVPTFGEVSEEKNAAEAEEQALSENQPREQMAQQASTIKFLVDTRTGEFEPVLPGQPDPQPGPTEILMVPNQEDPRTPEILAMGKRVTQADIARLGDPKRQVQPKLRSSFQLPPEFQQLAESLGITQGEPAAEEEVPA